MKIRRFFYLCAMLACATVTAFGIVLALVVAILGQSLGAAAAVITLAVCAFRLGQECEDRAWGRI